MNASQERRLLLAALDYAAADVTCRRSRTDLTISRADALKRRRKAKARLLRAVGDGRQQIEMKIQEAFR